VTRSDFDGLVCAVLPKDLGIIDDIKFIHPKDMQDGTILISDGDITTNLPYVDGVHLAFDHHHSETIRVSKKTITSSTLTRHRLRGLFMTITVAKRSSQVSLKI
jgi:hypothetical protein